MFEAHFQSFDDRTDRTETALRISALRVLLRARGLDGFIVPRADRFQNEYVPPCAERLAWLTGFTGSAGLAIVLADRAVIFVDGRYQVQVREEIDGDLKELLMLMAALLDMAKRDAHAIVPGYTHTRRAQPGMGGIPISDSRSSGATAMSSLPCRAKISSFAAR